MRDRIMTINHEQRTVNMVLLRKMDVLTQQYKTLIVRQEAVIKKQNILIDKLLAEGDNGKPN